VAQAPGERRLVERQPLDAPELAPDVVLGRLGGENFPVAMRILPRRLREDLVAVYGAARLIDEVGDALDGDRKRALDVLEVDLRAAVDGTAHHPLLRRLSPVLTRHDIGVEPFLRLVEANRWDQRSPDLATWSDLLDYCALSANPIGEIVLALFDQATPENVAASDRVCSALQVLEHCQDVAEDAHAGRVYLPREDRARFDCGEQDLVRSPGSLALRLTVACQVARAREMLADGDALCRRLRGIARPVVAGYVAGGAATARALERAAFDPNFRPVRPRSTVTLGHWLRSWLPSRRAA
jgi:squalene synthase HpnC